jgi:hypothetical protein
MRRERYGPPARWASVAARPGMTGLVIPGSPAEGRDTEENEGDCEGGRGRQGRKRSRAAPGTPRRPFRGAAVADSGAGWSRADNAGQSVDRSSENRPASRPRGDVRPPGGSEADVAISAALETAEVVAMARGSVEPPAADAARISGWSASRRTRTGHHRAGGAS